MGVTTQAVNEVALASDTWESLLNVHNRLQRAFQADEVWSKISMREYDILYSLAKAGEPVTQSELLDAVLLSQPAVSRMLSRMESKGWLTRQRCVEDGRTWLIGLTESGTQMQRQVGRVHGRQIAKRLTSALSADQMESLKCLCDQIVESAGE